MTRQILNPFYDSRGKGFTVVELLVAMAVSAIILSAVATLAYTVTSIDDPEDGVALKQDQIRYTTMRLSELIRYSKLILANHAGGLIVWRADDNDDGQVNVEELVYIEIDSANLTMKWVTLEPQGASRPLQTISILKDQSEIENMKSVNVVTEHILMTDCVVTITTDVAEPWSEFVSILIKCTEGGEYRYYQINAALRAYSDDILDVSGNIAP